MTQLIDLAARWQAEAGQLRDRYFNGTAADVLERARVELLSAVEQGQSELLTLVQASRESGYTPRHLRRLIREGLLPDYGRLHAPKVRRGDLPRKPAAVKRAAGG